MAEEHPHPPAGHDAGGAAHKPHKKHGGGHGGHGGGSHEEHEGAPEWLISFADNVTLMMGFFVILLAMNLKEPTTGGIGGKEDNAGGAPTSELPHGVSEEMLDAAIAIRAAFNNPVDPTSNDPNDQLLIRRMLDRVGPSKSATEGPRGRDHDVQSIRPTDYYAYCGKVEFAYQSVELSEQGRTDVIELAKKIAGHMVIVEVRGHSSAAEGLRDREQGSRLGFERALAVADVLAENGVDWWQMRLTSSGHHDRVEPFPMSSREDLANARVEIILTEQPAPDRTMSDPNQARREARDRITPRTASAGENDEP